MTEQLKTLFDTSAIVAMLDKVDEHHELAVQAAGNLKGRLLTTWPVVTEADYLLERVKGGRQALRRMLLNQKPALVDLPLAFVDRYSRLVQQFADRDVQVADASLIWAAEVEQTSRIFTFDRNDFEVYRIQRGHEVIPFGIVP